MRPHRCPSPPEQRQQHQQPEQPDGGLIGLGKGEKHNKQPCYFELQLESRDFKIEGPFTLFLLAPKTQLVVFGM